MFKMKLLLISLFVTIVVSTSPMISIPVQATSLWQETYTTTTVNNHSGYTTEWRGSGALDKPIIVVLGYDPSDDDTALDAVNQYADLISELNYDGFDVIVFDYLDGDADIRDNADNLARFVEYLDSRMSQEGFPDINNDGHPDYELAITGGSMGGIVTRTMFVQEYQNMGVDIFVTVDSPHYGVYLSPYVDWIAAGLDNIAGQQMLHGSSTYNELYGWLQETESDPTFKQNVIDPLDTAAIALSNGESQWKVSWTNLIIHTKYHPVTSYISTILGDIDFIPYHSAVYLDNTDVKSSVRWGYNYYKYYDTATSYFDQKITNPRDSHGGHEYAVRQAMDFTVLNWG